MTTGTRTISREEWEEAYKAEPIKCGGINNAVDKCMLELDQPELTLDGVRSCTPWSGPEETVLGAMWAGTLKIDNAFKDPEGAWMVPSGGSVLPTFNVCSHYIRLSPAPPDVEVQYGLCVLKWDRFDEFVQKLVMVEGELPAIKCMPIAAGRDSSFRVDTMIAAALRVAHGRPSNRVSNRFRELLGSVELVAFLVDMLRGCYSDSRTDRNILYDRSPQHIEMVSIVAEKAYPGFLRPDRKKGEINLRRFVEAHSLPDLVWCSNYLYPLLSNVVVPEPIFSIVSRNMEVGIPPIVPQYVTSRHHMFNGNWDDPCTGLEVSSGAHVSACGKKILGGVTNTFNTDRYGRASYWPFGMNPPREWVDSFVHQLVKLSEEAQPVSLSDRADLALLCARDIPVVMNVVQGSGQPVLKYKRLVELDRNNNNRVTRVVVEECNASGGECNPTNPTPACSAGPPTPGTPDGPGVDLDSEEDDGETVECNYCGNTTPLDDLRICPECDDSYCCDDMLDCLGCGRSLCRNCHEYHTSCQSCSYCGENELRGSMRQCIDCGVADLCHNCYHSNDHDCQGGEVNL